MSLWTSAEIAAATGGTAHGVFHVDGVAFDSREVGANDLFVAMPGSTTDGHRFLDTAFAQGAGGAIVSRSVEQPHVLVGDTARALEALGAAARARTKARIAGVTGSVGKTGTKEALAAALARLPGTRVHRSVKSYNNHTGVPLSLARMAADSDYGVFEMGMNHAGEIAALTAQVRPHVALITAIAPAHIENLGSMEAIADAKAEIFQGLEPGGTAIVPWETPYRERLLAAARRRTDKVMTFGLSKDADVHAIDRVAHGDRTQVTAKLPGAQLGFTVGQAGEHWVTNALGVLAAVQALGGDLGVAGLALAELEGLEGRGARFEAAVAGGHATVIDESYNANAASMAATLKVLGEQAAERRIAVLGEMGELGETSDRLHAGLAEPLLAAKVDQVVLVGPLMAPLVAALRGQLPVEHVPDASTAAKLVTGLVRANDAVLVKGSNYVGMAKVVAALRGN